MELIFPSPLYMMHAFIYKMGSLTRWIQNTLLLLIKKLLLKDRKTKQKNKEAQGNFWR